MFDEESHILQVGPAVAIFFPESFLTGGKFVSVCITVSTMQYIFSSLIL